MKKPRALLNTIIHDPYATDASKQAACRLFNFLRRQVGRRKRAVERLGKLEAALAAKDGG